MNNLNISPIVLRIILLNVVVFAAWWIVPYEEVMYQYLLVHKLDILLPRVELKGGDWENHFMPVQVITYMFSHKDLWHLLFNLMALVSFGSIVEMVLGARRFLVFYFFCGIFAGLVTAVLDPSPIPVLGASGALFGVMVAYAWLFPDQKLGIMFLPIQFRARPFMWITGGISLVFVVADYLGRPMGGRISHFGHLAGAVGAVVLLFGGQLGALFRRNRN